LTDLSNRRHENAKLLSGQIGAGMFKTLVSELGADMDGDGLPDLAERPSNRGRANETSGDMDLEDLVTYLVEERLKERERAARPVVVSENGHGPSAARPTQRPDGR
jgi:hypothetical protein